MLPFKIKHYYQSIIDPRMVFLIEGAGKEAPKVFRLKIDWFIASGSKYTRMDIKQEMVVNTDNFEKLYREIKL
jgi:hypothetical protein